MVYSAGTPGREPNFHDKAAALGAFSQRAVAAAGVVAAGVGHNKRLADQLIHNAQQVIHHHQPIAVHCWT